MPDEFDIDNPEIKALLRRLAEDLHARMPDGWGFCLLIFEFSGEATFYISDAQRSDMMKALQEFIRVQKARGH
jgi:hypothetical protein